MARIAQRQSVNGATFLLVINVAIGLSFAAVFLWLANGSHRLMAQCCATGFMCAALVVLIEAVASFIPWPRLTSGLSFTFLLLALTLIVMGIGRYFHPKRSWSWLWGVPLGGLVIHQLIIFPLPRDSAFHAFAYQGMFSFVSLMGAILLLRASKRFGVEWILAAVFIFTALQFVAKAVLAHSMSTGQSVDTYIFSVYAYYSQTAGAVLSLVLGVTLVALLAREQLVLSTRKAQLDLLSGTMTRALFYQEAEHLLRSVRNPSCLILADLDHFKTVNDRFGHAAGDEVIAYFGRIINDLAADAGICGRVGGEEFAIILKDCDAHGGEIFAEGVKRLMNRSNYLHLPEGTRVTASFGIAVVHPGEALASLMQRADAALYAAKNSGRNRARIASPVPA